MTLKQRAVRGAFWSATQLWGQQTVSFVLFIVLARLLVPNDFGLVALAFTFIGFIQVFLDQGFGSAIIQLETVDDLLLSTAFWSNLAFGIPHDGRDRSLRRSDCRAVQKTRPSRQS